MEITRSGILRECLEEKNREMHRYSKHEAGLVPLDGYEKHFEDLRETCDLLRGMIQNVEKWEEEARKQAQLAGWQMDVIRADCRGEHPDLSWADKTALQTVDEMVLRRRYRKAEDYKPAPVVYPGGEENGNL